MTAPRRLPKRADCQSRLAKCARAVPELDWTGATHSFEAEDAAAAPVYGAGSEVYFNATRRVGRGTRVVFLHRRRRRAILVMVLIKAEPGGWIVGRVEKKRPSRMSRADWVGPYPMTAIKLPAAKRLARTQAGRST